MRWQKNKLTRDEARDYLLAEGRLRSTLGAYFFCFLILYFSCNHTVHQHINQSPFGPTKLHPFQHQTYLRKCCFFLICCTIGNESFNYLITFHTLPAPNKVYDSYLKETRLQIMLTKTISYGINVLTRIRE